MSKRWDWSLSGSTAPTTRREAFEQAAGSALRLVEPDVGDGWWPGYDPYPHQLKFHLSPARYRLIGGAAGPGKTLAMVAEAVRLCRTVPGLHCALFRRTIPELWETGSLILTFLENVPLAWRGWSATRRKATFTNGSTLSFRACEHEGDVTQYQSAQWGAIGIDELTHWTPYMFRYLWSRLRSTRPGVPSCFFAATNPGGIGHGAVKDLWVTPRQEFADELKVDLAEFDFIPALVDDNPRLLENDPTYLDRLESLPEAERKALRWGDWNSFAGQFFREWLDSLHVCEPFEIPASWPKVRAIDYGGTAPFACVWLALDPANGIVYLYREHYAAGKGLKWHVEQILAASAGERYIASVGDPSMFAKTQERESGDRVSIADQAAALGLKLEPANNDRLGGWRLVKELMTPEEVLVDVDELIKRARFVVFRTCTNTVRTMPTMVHQKKGSIEDMETKGVEDHLSDAARYGVIPLVGKRKKATPRTGTGRRVIVAASAYGNL